MSGLNCARGLSRRKYSCSAPTVIFTKRIPLCPSVLRSLNALPSTASSARSNGVFRSNGVPSYDRKTDGMKRVPPLGVLTMKAGLEMSHAEYPRASKVERVPADGKLEASGSPCAKCLPLNTSMGFPSVSDIVKARCFSAVSSV